MNILSILKERLDERDALWRYPEEKREFRLSEIVAAATRYGAHLRDAGVTEGSRVGVLLENRSAYAPLLLAIWSLKAIAVPLRPISGRYFEFGPYLRSIHRTCGLSALVLEDLDPESVIATWAAEAGVVCLDLAGLERDPVGAAVTLRGAGAGPRDTAVIQYSSGSTGDPKGVVVTHGMMLAQLRQINAELADNCRGMVVRSSSSWLPFNHDMGLFIGLLNPLFTGADNLLASPKFYMMKPRRWFALLAEHAVDLNFTTNSAMQAGLRAMKQMEPINLSRLYVYLGAEKVHPSTLADAYRILGPCGMTEANFRVGYGMAENTLGAVSTKGPRIEVNRFRVDETGRVMPAASEDAEAMDIVALGQPVVGTRISIRDSEGRELPDLRIGEITIEGDCVMPGYYNHPEASLRALDGRRLRTRDLGFRYRGELYFHSRKDDLLIVGGQNIVPDDVEAKVEELDFVRPTGSVLLGCEKEGTGEMELALLVEVKGAATLDEALQAEQRRQIQNKAYEACRVLVSHVLFCENGTIEKTSSGKKRRKVIGSRILSAGLALGKA